MQQMTKYAKRNQNIKDDILIPSTCNRYRRLALRFHPKLSALDEKTTQHHFSLISEAYEVLSDSKLKLILKIRILYLISRDEESIL